MYLYIAILTPAGVIKSPVTRVHVDNTHFFMMHITCHVISPQLNVQCNKMKRAPCEIKRGSATTDDQFVYFTPHDSKFIYSYQWSIEKWEKLPPSPYLNSGLVIIDGELTAVGGYDGHTRTNKLYVLRQGQWVQHYPPMNTERSSPAVISTSDGNYIVVIGGFVGGVDWTVKVDLFHVRSRRWFKLTNLPRTLHQPSATICGNHLHVIGLDGPTAGYSCSLQALLSIDQPIKSQSILNILTWSPLPQLPVEWSTAATLCGQLLLVGGRQGGSSINSIHQLIDGQWLEIGSMSIGRMMCLVVSRSPDKMMIAGGWGKDSVEECGIVQYDICMKI